MKKNKIQVWLSPAWVLMSILFTLSLSSGSAWANNKCPRGNCVTQTQCADRNCGDNGCGKECGQCPTGQGCSLGKCVSASCARRRLRVSGVFKNSIHDISFDSVAVAVTHKLDIDQWEDGCIHEVTIILSKKGTDCRLMVTASGTLDSKETLTIQSMSLTARSQCPGFADRVEGLYSGFRLEQGSGVILGITEVPGQNAKESCFNSTMTLSVTGNMNLTGNMNRERQVYVVGMKLLPSSIEIQGDFSSRGDEEVSCPCKQVKRVRKAPRRRPRPRRRPWPVEKPEPSDATFDLILGLGTNTCLDSGDVECGDDSTSVGFLVGLGSRFSPNFGVYLDMSYGWLYPDNDPDYEASISTLTIMPTLRAFAPFSDVELMAGIGLGYSSRTSSRPEGYSQYSGYDESSWSSFASMKLTSGVVFKVAQSIGLGLLLDYVIHVDETGENCTGEVCNDNNSDRTDLLQVYFMMKAGF